MHTQQMGKVSQPLLIAILILLSAGLAGGIIWSSNSKKSENSEGENHNDIVQEHGEEGHDHESEIPEGVIELSAQQLVEQGIQLASASLGAVEQRIELPGKLMVNTDQQAHISPNFSGHVEQVNVALGETVQKGQTLAVLLVPELIDQQANLAMAQSNLNLSYQDYLREKQLWSQGVSAKQDYQRAENAYRQAQITVQSTQAKIRALGGNDSRNGRFEIKAPISGVISQKDIVMGENVQLADQLFTIEQLKDLWLEFVVPSEQANVVQAGQKIRFKTLPDQQIYEAVIQSLTTQADVQTGRLVVRAKVISQANALRPNVMVNVELNSGTQKFALRVQKQAIQTVDGKSTVFVVKSQSKGRTQLQAQTVEFGQASSDRQWIEIKSGLNSGQRYVARGSFLLKSELEKDEADHGH